MAEGDLANAVLLFEAACQQDPNSAEAWQLLGTTLAENEQESPAIAALSKCLELDRGNSAALLALAVSYTNESLYADACEALKNWVATRPDYAHLIPPGEESVLPKRRISSFANPEQLGEVEKILLEAIRERGLAEMDPSLQNALGIFYNVTGDYAKAVDCFQTALQLQPEVRTEI